jgi:hypothetical protein
VLILGKNRFYISRHPSEQAVEKGMATSKRTLKGAATSDKINGLRFGSRRL